MVNPILNVRETMFLSTGELTNSQTFIAADGVHATVAFEKDADRDVLFSLTRGADVFSFGIDFHPFKPGGVMDKMFPMKWTMRFNNEIATTPAISGNESEQALTKKFEELRFIAIKAQTTLLCEARKRMADFLARFVQGRVFTDVQTHQILQVRRNVIFLYFPVDGGCGFPIGPLCPQPSACTGDKCADAFNRGPDCIGGGSDSWGNLGACLRCQMLREPS